MVFAMQRSALPMVLAALLRSKTVKQDSSGNRDNTSNSGSRCANFNNALSNSNWNNSLRAASDDWQTAPGPTASGGALVSLLYPLRRIRLEVRRTASSENRKPRRLVHMGKKHKNLFEQIVAPDNLRLAFRKTAKGKRSTEGYKDFNLDPESRLRSIQRSLTSGRYRQGKPHIFTVYEPKQRIISALPFRDRVVQHAVNNIIEPIFESVFLPQSYACRVGKGTHAAARDVQAELRRMYRNGETAWVLKTDFSKYFFSISCQRLHHEFRRKISCKPTLQLLEKLIPPARTGIPIGELLSQVSANLYGHIVDRWLVHTQRVSRFFRYMDDIVVLGACRHQLNQLRQDLEDFAKSIGLSFSHWSIQPAARGINFVGYRIWRTHKLLRRDSVLRAKRKIKRYLQQGEHDRLEMFLAAWRGHAGHADSHNLLRHLGVT